MDTSLIIKAAGHFIGNSSDITIEPIGNGLIHQTYKASNAQSKKTIVLQAINTSVFKSPADIMQNYNLLYNFLRTKKDSDIIPAPVHSAEGKLIWKDEIGNTWRATEFIEGSSSQTIAGDEKAAFTVAASFARFTKSLSQLHIGELKEIIPNFHNLSFRYKQFEEAIGTATQDRLLKSTHIIAELRQRKKLVDFFDQATNSPGYPCRVMHHDCKISNILFDKESGRVICPVDLDTVMPGKFFSDLGDMIRSMACTVDENSTEWEKIDIRPTFYKSILSGYLEGIGNIFTDEEKKNIHYAGLILVYMQALRFIADYLNNDVYYKTTYPEQNLSRATNQLVLLEKLEAFLKREFSFSP
ncbi:MAG: aminoglycoside phosphotransferase family protein [Bacteroidetes bacterium]|nr:aminoglycoside phosphotransferase family protein [Bacteroidota bacterium]MBS1973951.1 aminoglycoside phosphotransferase family protein [Bacteroidota bacterium]